MLLWPRQVIKKNKLNADELAVVHDEVEIMHKVSTQKRRDRFHGEWHALACCSHAFVPLLYCCPRLIFCAVVLV